MKKILITGANSYIGENVEAWLLKEPNNYSVDTLDMKDPNWVKHNFKKYDVVFHVAGISHVLSDPKMEDIYYKVNRDLTIEVAEKAKREGVKQFIFMSSIIVYGNSQINKKIINKNTVPCPSNYYGKSKLQAEQGIRELNSDKFKIVLLRPPMIYGKGSLGNYPKLSKLAQFIPLFPNIANERSMLHIDNLCEFIKIMIDLEEKGLYFPQNKEYVRTSELVKAIAAVHGKRIWFIGWMNWLVRLMFGINVIRKLFGNLVYEKSMSEYNMVNYRIRTFQESIKLTEGTNKNVKKNIDISKS